MRCVSGLGLVEVDQNVPGHVGVQLGDLRGQAADHDVLVLGLRHLLGDADLAVVVPDAGGAEVVLVVQGFSDAAGGDNGRGHGVFLLEVVGDEPGGADVVLGLTRQAGRQAERQASRTEEYI